MDGKTKERQTDTKERSTLKEKVIAIDTEGGWQRKQRQCFVTGKKSTSEQLGLHLNSLFAHVHSASLQATKKHMVHKAVQQSTKDSLKSVQQGICRKRYEYHYSTMHIVRPWDRTAMPGPESRSSFPLKPNHQVPLSGGFGQIRVVSMSPAGWLR